MIDSLAEPRYPGLPALNTKLLEIKQKMLEVVETHKLRVIPLYTIVDGHCSCREPDCSSPGKHPLLRTSWKLIATHDRGKLEKWFARTDNFAVLTGHIEDNRHLVVVDFDEQGKKNPWVEQLKEITFGYETGNGYHFWFFSKEKVSNSAKLVGPGIDIRGEGGYVVIPPSRHVSGKRYKPYNGSFLPIADFDSFPGKEFVKKAPRERKPRVKKEPSLAPLVPMSPAQPNWGQGKSIPEVQELLKEGNKIPNGARNTTLHRLLASERAKGKLEPDLRKKAIKYNRCMEVPLSDGEVAGIVRSVAKYPAYNNSFEQVNEVFARWMKKRGRNVDSVFLKEKDAEFFVRASPANDNVLWLPLEKVVRFRAMFLHAQGLVEHSHYKPSLLGSKLKAVGVSRKRQAKGNLWGVSQAFYQETMVGSL